MSSVKKDYYSVYEVTGEYYTTWTVDDVIEHCFIKADCAIFAQSKYNGYPKNSNRNVNSLIERGYNQFTKLSMKVRDFNALKKELERAL